MTIQNWSDKIISAELTDDPQFTEEMNSLMDMLEPKCFSVAINLSAVSHINSSNISALLRLRKRVLAGGCRLILCSANSRVHGVFTVTGLDKVFEFTEDVATALASIQIANQTENPD